jgi:hypothetical protein
MMLEIEDLEEVELEDIENLRVLLLVVIQDHH